MEMNEFIRMFLRMFIQVGPYQGGFWNGADWIPKDRRDQRG